MNRIIRTGLAFMISYLPFNGLRCLLYRLLFGYSIKNSQIGMGTLLTVAEATIEGAAIGRSNRFMGPMSLVIKNGAKIGKNNLFVCNEWTMREEFKDSQYDRCLILAEDSLIADAHFFDVAGKLVVGQGSWVAGRDSQFWTHGAGVRDRNIQIGKHCYIGSAARFAPGSELGNNVLVAMGSVVTGKLTASNQMIGGVPARVIKEDYDWRAKQSIEHA
jgi:acetyltransferase-like isoleucine patch superfamily enzyme